MQDKYITPAYKHSKLGNFLFFLCAKVTRGLVKARWLYYLLACTWGFIFTLIGLLITGVLAIAKLFNKNISFEKYNWIYFAKVGPDYWGGFEMGLMFVRDQKSYYVINEHEFGHTFQNCLFGPFMLFLVSLPSAIRYWYRELKYERKGLIPPTDYDAIWFEDAATRCGAYAVAQIAQKRINKKK